MLQPKRTKYRKAFKGRISGAAKGGFNLDFGAYGLKAMEPDRLTARQIEAARRAITRHMKRAGRVWIRVFPDVPVSKKPAEVRMGSGKGAPEFWAARVKPGRVLFELDGVSVQVAREALELAGGLLEAQVELLLLEARQIVGELVLGLGPNVRRLHGLDLSYSAMRCTKRVRIGSFAAPRRSASRASSTDTPSISNMMRPGLIRHAQYSGVPLPLPMRTSVGFLDTGTSGKTRIHTRPARFISRVIARRAASIWRAVTRSGSSAFRPNEPKVSSAPEVAVP